MYVTWEGEGYFLRGKAWEWVLNGEELIIRGTLISGRGITQLKNAESLLKRPLNLHIQIFHIGI